MAGAPRVEDVWARRRGGPPLTKLGHSCKPRTSRRRVFQEMGKTQICQFIRERERERVRERERERERDGE